MVHTILLDGNLENAALNVTSVTQSPTFPKEWRFVPVSNNKAPIGSEWQKNLMTWDQALALLGKRYKGQMVAAIGCFCGEQSGGLLFVDHDGDSVDHLIAAWGVVLPSSWEVRSNRPDKSGRYQRVYSVAPEHWATIKHCAFKTGTVDPTDGKPEQLELRWGDATAAHQSVVWGQHTTGSAYSWHYTDQPIAPAPQWILEKMLKVTDAPLLKTSPQAAAPKLPSANPYPIEVYESALESLTIDRDWEVYSGVLLAAHHVGIEESLVRDWSSKHECHDDREFDRIWQNIKGNSVKPRTGGTLLKLAKEQGWQNPHGKVIPINANVQHPQADLKDQIKALFEANLNPVDRDLEKAALRAAAGLSEREFAGVWDSIAAEQENDAEADRAALDALGAAGSEILSCSEFINPVIGDRLDERARLLGGSPAAVLMTLLSVVSSLCKIGTELNLDTQSEFSALPIYWSCIVAISGAAKSPTQKLVTKPLTRLQSIEKVEHTRKLKAFNKAEKQGGTVDEFSPDGDLEEKPQMRSYYSTDATTEAIAFVQHKQPEYGFLLNIDELSGLLDGQNQYKGGKGNDKQAYLRMFDGGDLVVHRKGDAETLFVAQSGVSITGGIQDEILQKHMKDADGEFSDPSGFFSRFDFCCMPYARPVRNGTFEDYKRGTKDNLAELLAGVYSLIDSFDACKYELDAESYILYQAWLNEMDDCFQAASDGAMQSVYAKKRMSAGRVALLLHIIKAAIVGEPPAPIVDAETVEAAITLSRYAIEQRKQVNAIGGIERGETAPILQKIIDLSVRKGWISAKDVQQAVRSLKKTKPDHIRQYFSRLVEMGKGETEGSGVKLRFRAAVVQSVDKTVDTVDGGRQGVSTPAKADTASSTSKAIDGRQFPSNRELVDGGVA
jgi:Protein of unknown function (DUF3987)/Bifunctional DNA primase/polymerase, N-terminal/Primase C terminal 2 (PriCT-2)